MSVSSERATRTFACALLCLAPLAAGALDVPPPPELAVPVAISEGELDALSPGDARRVRLLVDLAVRRHADADEVGREELVAHERAVAEWRQRSAELPAAEKAAPPPLATPRADALRAQAVRFAERALEEAPHAAELPAALLVAGIDAAAIGRSRDALRMLGLLIRRFADDGLVADAWLALGEHHLRGGDLTRARVAFDQAERRGRPAVRAWAEARLAEMAQRAAADTERGARAEVANPVPRAKRRDR